jgi:hypothetical protein
MSSDWESTELRTEADVFDSLAKLRAEGWLFRGETEMKTRLVWLLFCFLY